MENEQNAGISFDQLLTTIEITNIGVFIWNLQTDHVLYSKEWANIVGYDLSELAPNVSTWESMLVPEDLEIADKNINLYLNGETDLYDSKFRMIKKDGTVIWGHDKGKITEYDKDGKPLLLCGVLQDITALKNAEIELRESTEHLEFAIEAAEFGAWDWNIETDYISYSDSHLEMFGHTHEDTNGSFEEWESRINAEDVPIALKQLEDYIAGKIARYSVDIRLKHADGHYIWVRDSGKIVKRDEQGNPTRMIGGHFKIDTLKKMQCTLEETLSKLEHHQTHLEAEIENRTKEIVEQDTLLMEITEIAKNLLSANTRDSYDDLMLDSLEKLASAFNTPEISLWRVVDVQGVRYSFQSYVYETGRKHAFKVSDIVEYIESFTDDNQLIHVREDGNNVIRYSLLDPAYIQRIEAPGAVVTDFLQNIPDSLRDNLQSNSKTYRSFLLASVHIEGKLFGYVALSDEKENVQYSETQENMLKICGSLFANARHKYEMDEQLRQAHEEAILSSKAKSSFLANMSHEIRTPLNAILGMSEIILRESLGRSAEEYAVEIRNASENLLSIINDILDISKIESGKLEIIEVDYYISSLLNDVSSLSRIRLQNRKVLFTTFIDSSIPSLLKGDEIRIKQILLNILSNAIKFTREGHIHFNATCTHENGKALLQFTVSDTGMGIKQADLDRLFLQFERFDTKKNRNIEGTGLGLAITKQLCDMMHGTISVESVVGRGSTFTVTIPQTYTEYTPIVSTPAVQNVLVYEARELYADSIKESIVNVGSKCTICTNQSDLLNLLYEQKFDYLFAPSVHFSKIKNLKEELKAHFEIVLMIDPGDTIIYRDTLTANLPISCLQLANVFGTTDLFVQARTKTEHFIAPDIKVLVVDDNQVNLKVAKGLMAPYKFAIDTATNGEIAVEMVKNNVYDLVFMDHMMPEMDGVDATIAIRKLRDEYFQKLPIIALTANAIVGAKELFVKEGMNDFLAKPIEMHKLNAILLEWIPADKIQFVTFQAPIYDYVEKITPSISITGIDTERGIKAIGGNVEDYLDVLRSFYSEGIKKVGVITDALNRLDITTYRIEVHAVKSASASIGAYELSELAKNLEKAAIDDDMPFITSHTADFIASYKQVLDELKETLQVNTEQSTQGNPIGNGEVLQDTIQKLEEALDMLDIDTIEQSLEVGMSYNWQGEINNLLQSIRLCTEAFEYYNAKPPLEQIKAEMQKYYV